MKKMIFSAILVMAVAFSANAQSYKWFIGGNVGFWTGKDNGLKNTKYSIMPEIGYSISNNWTIAAAFGYEYTKKDSQEINGTTIVKVSTTTKGFRFNPYVRYSFLKKGILTAFVDGSASFGTQNNKGFEAGLKPGVAVALTNRFCVVAHFGFLGYSDGKYLYGRDKGFGLDLSGYQSSFGFYYSF